MNLFLIVPASLLLVLAVTRAIAGDWKRSGFCAIVALALLAIHHVQFGHPINAKRKAKEVREMRDHMHQQEGTSNTQMHTIECRASASLGKPKGQTFYRDASRM
jgi:hypothetical protein